MVDIERILEQAKFSLSNIKNYENMVTFYTGFPSLKAVYDFLGSVDNLKYSKKQESDIQSGAENKRLHLRSLPPLEEFFMTLVHLRLGLIEQDLAYRFGLS